MELNVNVPKMTGHAETDIKSLYNAFLQQRKSLEYVINNIDKNFYENGIVIGNNTASITVNSNNIDLKVGADEVISKINLSPEGIKIDTSRLDVSGYVTFTNLSTGGQTAINGDNITTGTINANRIATNISQVNQLLYIGSQGGTTTKEIRFESGTRLTGGDNGTVPWFRISTHTLNLIDPEDIDIGNPASNVDCDGSWDFSSATVTGVTCVFG